jgi:hypothetical protein
MQHTKLRRLVRVLKVPQYAAVGILESLWHLTAREAELGDIGKLSDEDIADVIGWEGAPAELIAALVDSGWLDRSEEFRLSVHDWEEHADDATKLKIKRARGSLSENVRQTPTVSPESPPPLPEPLPLPLPEPMPLEQATAANEPAKVIAIARTPVSDADVERVYAAYPRKVGKPNAMAEIRKAVAHLASGKDWPVLHGGDAISLLHEKATRYARSPAGNAGDYTPHPATWFNQARYLDDESEWQRGSNSANSGGNGQRQLGNRKANDANGALQRSQERARAELAEAESRIRAAGAGEIQAGIVLSGPGRGDGRNPVGELL